MITILELLKAPKKKLFVSLWLLFFATWAILVFLDYYSIQYSGFDTGIYAHVLSRFWNYGNLQSTIVGKNALSDHFTPNFLLFAPLLSLWKSFLWLPILKLAAFFSCPFLLVVLSRQVLSSKSSLVYLVPCMFVLSSYLNKTLAFEFQVSSLSLPFVILAFILAERKRFIALGVCLVFLLGFKEHMALCWVSIGLFLAFFKNERGKGIAIIGLGILAGLSIYSLVMPTFDTSAGLSHMWRFGPFNAAPAKIRLIFMGLASVCFIPLFQPKTLFFLIPAYGLALVSKHSLMHSYNFHYQDFPLTVLMIATIYGLREIEAGKSGALHWFNERKSYFLPAALVLFFAINHYFPMKYLWQHWPTPYQKELISQIETFRTTITPKTRIHTLDSLAPYFFGQYELYSIKTKKLDPFLKEGGDLLVADAVNTWPLDEKEFENFKALLEEKSQAGELTKIQDYSPLIVYREAQSSGKRK